MSIAGNATRDARRPRIAARRSRAGTRPDASNSCACASAGASEIVAAGNGQSFGEPGRELIDADVRVQPEDLKEAPRAAEACTACA